MSEKKEIKKEELNKVNGGIRPEDVYTSAIGDGNGIIVGQGTNAGGAIYNDGTEKQSDGAGIGGGQKE